MEVIDDRKIYSNAHWTACVLCMYSILFTSCLLMLSAIVMLSLLRHSKNDEAKRRNISDPALVWDSSPFTWERYELRPVRKLLVPVQRPRRSQTGLSSFSDQFHVNTHTKKCMDAGLSSSRSRVNTPLVFINPAEKSFTPPPTHPLPPPPPPTQPQRVVNYI